MTIHKCDGCGVYVNTRNRLYRVLRSRVNSDDYNSFPSNHELCEVCMEKIGHFIKEIVNEPIKSTH